MLHESGVDVTRVRIETGPNGIVLAGDEGVLRPFTSALGEPHWYPPVRDGGRQTCSWMEVGPFWHITQWRDAPAVRS